MRSHRRPDAIDRRGPAVSRRDMLRGWLAAGSLAGWTLTRPPDPAAEAAPQAPQGDRVPTAEGLPSLSRQLAAWAAALRFDDLPPAVVDRAKGLTVHGLASALLGSQTASGRSAVGFITEEEEGVRAGATILVSGERVTGSGAAFANAELMLAGGKWDTFRMLTHPGTSILPAGLAAAEAAGASGRAFLTGIVAGYEVMERLAADFIPTVMARGFHAGPVFGIFGAAVAAAKISGLTEDELTAVIGLSVNLAGANLEAGGLREGAAVRNALLAVALAGRGTRTRETALEGRAGFYHAYAGNNQGRLTYSFVGDTETSLDRITANLGQAWLMLETLYRIYSIPGYNIAHVDVTAALCAEHDLRYEQVERVEAEVNWYETQYPSPAFPSTREDLPGAPRRGSTRYYSAYGVVERGFPLLGATSDPPAVLDLMQRVTIIPSHRMGLFAPRITVFTRDGRSYTKQATGREFMWDFAEETRRIRGVTPGLPIPPARFEEIIRTCGALDAQPRADALVQLTLA